MSNPTPPVRSLRRRLLIVAGGLLALLAVAAVALPFLVDVNRFRPLIQEKAEQALGRKVTLGPMKLSLFPSVGIAIESPRVEGLVSARSLTVGARLLPLLSGRVELKRVILDRPEISLRRDANGQWDLPGGDAQAKQPESPAAPQPFELGELVIREGLLTIDDRKGLPRGAAPRPLGIPVSLTCSLGRDGSGTIALAGRIDLHDVKLPGAHRPIDAAAEVDLLARDEMKLLEIRRFVALVGHSRMELKGSVDNRQGRTRVDLEVPPASLAAEDLAQLLEITGVAPGIEMNAGEPVRLEGSIHGDIAAGSDPAIAGSVTVAGASFRHPSMTRPLESIHGTLALKKDGFSVSQFSAAIGGSDISGRLDVASLSAPRISFDLASRRADFMELLSILQPQSAAPAAPATRDTPATGPSLISRMSARGKLSIAEGSFGTLRFASLGSTLSLERQVARLNPVSMRLYGGEVDGEVTVDLGAQPLACTVEARPRGVDVGDLLKEALGMDGMLDGSLAGRLRISAAGDSRDGVLRAATGEGNVEIRNGRVGALNVLSLLSRASDVLGEKSLKQLSDKLAKEGTDFTAMTADLRVAGGSVSTENLTLISPDIELRDDGSLDLMAATIRMSGEILFSAALSQAMVDERSKAADYFWDTRAGRVNLPLTLSGPIDAPMPGIDWGSAGGKLARRKLQEAVSERINKAGLGELLGDRSGSLPARSSPPGPGASGEPAPPAATSAPGAPEIAVGESRFSGNFLVPDLKLKGTLAGTGLTKAGIRVLDGKGRVLIEEDLTPAIESFYASASRTAAVSIPFRVELDGKRLAAAGRNPHIVIHAEDSEGRVTEKDVEARR